VEKNEPLVHCLVGMKNGTVTSEISLAAPCQVKQDYRMTQQFLSWVYTQKNGSGYSNTCTQVLLTTQSIHSSWRVETTQMSISYWMTKQNVVHPYNEILLNHQEKTNLSGTVLNTLGTADHTARDSVHETSRTDKSKKQVHCYQGLGPGRRGRDCSLSMGFPWPYTNSDVEHVCNSATILWNSGKKGKEKKKNVNNTKTHHICAYKDVYWKLLNNGGWEGRGEGD
jgi:hypothetical protein